MKKKRQNLVVEPKRDIDLQSIIHQHSLFFDKLVDLIPAKFYLSVDDKEKKWFQGLSKGEKALAKKESRENIKKARRERLDPDRSSTSTLDVVMQNLQKEKIKDESDDEQEEINPAFSGVEDDDRKVTYEELRQRLHRKIEELRAGRGGLEKAKKNDNDKKKAIQQKKRKRETEAEGKKGTTSISVEKVEEDIAEATKELKFSHVKLGHEQDNGRKKKKRKDSKLKELEKAKELEEAKMDPEKGEKFSEKHSWKAATSRAAGIKVHDDPRLLKQRLKKEKKRQQKSAKKWEERVDMQQKVRAEKQQKRSQNIAERIQQKKMRQIAKREKKLSQPRPGFEGRKEGYINENST